MCVCVCVCASALMEGVHTKAFSRTKEIRKCQGCQAKPGTTFQQMPRSAVPEMQLLSLDFRLIASLFISQSLSRQDGQWGQKKRYSGDSDTDGMPCPPDHSWQLLKYMPWITRRLLFHVLYISQTRRPRPLVLWWVVQGHTGSRRRQATNCIQHF